MNSRDLELLKNILDYIEQIDEANSQFQNQKENFETNSVYRNSVALCVLQIGELAKKLSNEYKQYTCDEIPWHQIQGLRNVVAHEYGNIDADSLWETITEDIPVLCEFCKEQIAKYEELSQNDNPDLKM